MNTMSTIATVERETGLGKDTLRVWERRYGFPKPERDAAGDRLYPAEQVAQLRLIRRLMDRGYRPGHLVGASAAELAALAANGAAAAARTVAEPPREATPARSGPAGADADVDAFCLQLQAHDLGALRRQLMQWLAQAGLRNFVLEVVPELCRRVGDGWQAGEIQVFEEHLFTEQLQRLLRHAIADLPAAGDRPAVVLSTLPEEQHGLGILMLETLFAIEGLRCIPLGTGTPVDDIAAAAAAHRASAVALSFSGAFPARQVVPQVTLLRTRLDPRIALWLGGAGLGRGVGDRLRKAFPMSPGPATGALPAGVVLVGHSLHEACAIAAAATRPAAAAS